MEESMESMREVQSLPDFRVVEGSTLRAEDHIDEMYVEELKEKIQNIDDKIQKLKKEKDHQLIHAFTTLKIHNNEKKIGKLTSEIKAHSHTDVIESAKIYRTKKLPQVKALEKGGLFSVYLYEDEKAHQHHHRNTTALAKELWMQKGERILHLVEKLPDISVDITKEMGEERDLVASEYNNYGVFPDLFSHIEKKEDGVVITVQKEKYALKCKGYDVFKGQIFPKGAEFKTNCDKCVINKRAPGAQSWTFADGCGWGQRAEKSADRSTQVALAFLSTALKEEKQWTLQSVARAQLNALLEAHHIHEVEKLEGTTTLVLVTVVDGYVVITHVGDSSVLLLRGREEKQAILLTEQCRFDITDPKEPGGRIGEYVPLDEEGTSWGGDLRNLGVSIFKLQADDILLTCSDGITDCFDPEMRGLMPEDLEKGRGPVWEPDNISHVKLKQKYMLSEIEQLIGKENNIVTLSEIIEKFIGKLTMPSKVFMINNPIKALPKDYKIFPGKLDHSNSVWFSYFSTQPRLIRSGTW